MKELSIEQKAELYDEALKAAIITHKDEDKHLKATLERIFPELKEESEDERIMACIGMCLTDIDEQRFADFNTSLKECLAWLEKQGEHANFRNKIQIGDKVTRNRDGVLVNLSQLNRVAKKDEKQGNNADKIIERAKTEKQRVLLTETNGDANIDWDTRSLQDVKLLLEYGLDYIKKLEKQGKQKPYGKRDKCMDCQFNYAGECKGSCAMKQKPTNKVEPKFHKGDWIITNKNHIWYIDETPETTSYLYRLINQYGKVEVAEFEIVDKKARLWTIQDAKDGDVLYECNEKNPFIFKELKTKHIGDIASYCDIFNGIFNSNEDDWTTLDIVPATKEQRDQLEYAMANYGYKWNKEEHKLEKI